MNNCVKAVLAFLSFAFVAGATDFPTTETYLGYDFVRFDPDSHFFPSFNANGGSGQFIYNFDKWFGIATDISAVTKNRLNQTPVDTTVLQFVAGPRITYRRHGFEPFGEAMFGGAYGTTSQQISAVPVVTPFAGGILPNSPITARLVASRTGFAMLAGGGVDYKFSKHMAFRPFEFDYDLIRVPNFVGEHVNRNNWRFSAGVNFLFGKE
jgi:hypothetical protein